MLEYFISLLGFGTDTYGIVTGIRQGKQIKQIAAKLETVDERVEYLSSNILYAPKSYPLSISNTQTIQAAHDLKEIKDKLEPLSRISKEPILASALVKTPPKARNVFKGNPWDVLLDIKPLNSANQHSNPDLMPIVFDTRNQFWVGWQRQGVLPLILDLKVEQSPFWTKSPSIQVSKPTFFDISGRWEGTYSFYDQSTFFIYTFYGTGPKYTCDIEQYGTASPHLRYQGEAEVRGNKVYMKWAWQNNFPNIYALIENGKLRLEIPMFGMKLNLILSRKN